MRGPAALCCLPWVVILRFEEGLIGFPEGSVHSDFLHQLALLAAQDEAAHHADYQNQREDDDAEKQQRN